MKSLRGLMILSAVGLTSCGAQPTGAEPPSAPATAPVPSAAVPPPAAADEPPWVISPNGVRGVRIGMTGAEALEVLNRGIEPEAFGRWIEFGENLPDPQSCRGLGMQTDGEGEYGPLTFMVEGGRVTSYTILSGHDPALYVTERGVRPGAPEAEVSRAYPNAVQSVASYGGRPMRVFTVWTQGGPARPGETARAPESRGLSILVEEGSVWEIHAGGPSIQYVEGCP